MFDYAHVPLPAHDVCFIAITDNDGNNYLINGATI